MGYRGPMTHRQFLAWKVWLELEMNRPSRTDQYIMQVAAEVRRVLHKHPSKVQLNHFLLRFEKKGKGKKVTAVTNERSIKHAQTVALNKWASILGGKDSIRVIKVDAATYDPHKNFDVQRFIDKPGKPKKKR